MAKDSDRDHDRPYDGLDQKKHDSQKISAQDFQKMIEGNLAV